MDEVLELSPDVAEAAAWAENEIEKNPFSEVFVRFTIHGGKIKLIEKSTLQKVQPQNGK